MKIAHHFSWRKISWLVAAAIAFASTEALAQSQTGAPANSTTQTTSLSDKPHFLGSELWSVKPEAGIMEFTNATGSPDGRLTVGLGLDVNLVSLVRATPNSLYYGISSGVFFSHLGEAGSGFVGSGTGVSSGLSGANVAVIPLDLKLGYNVTDMLRLSVHGGGNVFYRSVGLAMSMGSNSATPDSDWDIYPNVGADFELALGDSTALLVRPDWTITPAASVFVGSVGFSWIFG